MAVNFAKLPDLLRLVSQFRPAFINDDLARCINRLSDVEAHTMRQCAAHNSPMTLPSVVRIAEQGMS